MYICKFGQNPSTSSEDNAQKPYFAQFKVPLTALCDLENKVKVTKIINYSPPPSNVSMQVWSKSMEWCAPHVRQMVLSINLLCATRVCTIFISLYCDSIKTLKISFKTTIVNISFNLPFQFRHMWSCHILHQENLRQLEQFRWSRPFFRNCKGDIIIVEGP